MAVHMCRRSRKGLGCQCGHAAVEAALMAPWLFLLFAMVFDIGFYSYAVIGTQNAARSGVMYTSQGTSYVSHLSRACDIALRELRGMPNVSASLTSCAVNNAVSDANPIAVGVAAITGQDSWPAARVTVTYRTPPFFYLPGLTSRLTVTRISEARVLVDN